jgi:hypothetical protein
MGKINIKTKELVIWAIKAKMKIAIVDVSDKESIIMTEARQSRAKIIFTINQDGTMRMVGKRLIKMKEGV